MPILGSYISAEGFVAEYRAQHIASPEHYPLELSADNSGLWLV